MRTHYTTDIQLAEFNTPITLSGWINNIRDHGGVYFIDLRDSKGLIQLVANPTVLTTEVYEKFHSLRDEWVIEVSGIVRNRGEGLENPKLKTGKIEIYLEDITVLSKSKTLPFQPGDSEVNEDIKLKYRYLEMRSSELQDTLHQRSKIAFKSRVMFDSLDYTEVETPTLIKSSEGGAEEVYATSKLFPTQFYSLPQSPQMYKQMLMIGGIEKYFSFAKCFRAESSRSDRHVEFTQIDMERAFADREMIMDDVSDIFFSTYMAIPEKQRIPFMNHKDTFKYLDSIGISTSMEKFTTPGITYHDAMEHFGSDKPDLRIKMSLIDAKQLFIDTDFSMFANIAKDEKQSLKAIVAKDSDRPDKLSKRKIRDLEKFVIDHGAKGLAYFQYKDIDGEKELKGPLTKMLSAANLTKIIDVLQLDVGDIVFFGAGETDIVLDYMGKLRLEIAKELSLFSDDFALLWVTDFPMFEKTSDGSIKSMHHPFTSPIDDSWLAYKAGEIDVLDILSDSYDLVLNGVELGGGSVRIHDQDLQYEIFDILGLSEDEIKDKFSFFIEALSYGTPPHAGFAFGFDRLVSLLLDKKTIREVIAFPKAQSALCPMTDSPNVPDLSQLKGLGLRIRS